MEARRAFVALVAVAAIAIPVAPAGAQGAGDINQSCVGWFASTGSQDGDLGQYLSGQAQAFQPFGATLVSPFAHLELAECQA